MKFLEKLLSAPKKIRTSIALRPLAPEASASASSAMGARAFLDQSSIEKVMGYGESDFYQTKLLISLNL